MSPTSEAIQITGITFHLLERLNHPLLVKLIFDGGNVTSALLKRREQYLVTRSFQRPRTLNEGSNVRIQVHQKHRDQNDKLLAVHNLSFENIWPVGRQATKYQIHLNDSKKQIWLDINILSCAPQGLSDIGQSPQPPERAAPLAERLNAARDTALQKLTVLRTMMENFGWEKYPIETGFGFEPAITELILTSKAVQESIVGVDQFQDQGQRDVLLLAEWLAKMINHIRPVKDIAELKELKTTLKAFPEQIQKMVNVLETCLNQSVPGHGALAPSVKEEIKTLIKLSTIFEKEFDRAFETDEMESDRITQDLEELKDYLLDGIKTVQPRAIECIPGTRATILADIITKTGDRDGTNMIWICGSPGCGKSSISLSAKSRLRSQGLLVTYFRFDRNETSIATPKALWRLVAYDLACRLPLLRSQFLQLLREDRVDLDSPVAVFTSLVENPLLNLAVDRPFVIVIDGLDECGGLMGRLSPDRQSLIQTLRRWTQLPNQFKLLVTSREEGDLARVLSTISTAVVIPSGQLLVENPEAEASIQASNDIRMFLEGRFNQLKERILSLPRNWPSTTTTTEMVGRAAGNFMWVTTAMNFVDGKGIDPQYRLSRIMDPTPQSRTMQPLYSLYNTILETAFGDIADGSDGSEAEALQLVLGVMVRARRPLQDAEYLKVVTTQPVSMDMLESIRDGLRSVIAPGDSLRFIHKTFDDFLLSNECPPTYRVNLEETEHLLCQFSLVTMTEGLRFNICDLETSYAKNVDVPNIETKIIDSIPALLSYSCCFWTDHLFSTRFDEYLMDAARLMMLDKLLYWFEAMSLLKEISRVSHSLLFILKWSHPSPDDEFKEFVHDARHFIRMFGQPIARSAPHIYISALPFSPEHSFVARNFLPRFPKILTLTAGQNSNWSPSIFTSQHHKAWIYAVAFSPDERYFASGSEDKTVCVCDSETGGLISGPFKITSSISRVFFDHDGKRVWASCEGGLLVGWDIETGHIHCELHAGHTIGFYRFNGSPRLISITKVEGTGEMGAITLWNPDTGERLHDLFNIPFSEGFDFVSISSDACYIACARSSETTIRIWKLADGSEIQRPLNSEPRFKHKKFITALSFSVTENFVVSGSMDGSILVWDVTTGDVVGDPLDTGKSWLHAIAYYPKNNILVAECGNPGMVTVWNATTHDVVLGPLEGHTGPILAIALSHDGRRALTASWDVTVRMWDLAQKAAKTHSNDEGDTPKLAVTFSPCGKKLASLDQKTIRVWDVYTGKSILGPLESVPSPFCQIIFSPDGRQIVAGFEDDSIQVWNSDTGESLLRHCYFDRILYISFKPAEHQFVACFPRGVVRTSDMEDGVMGDDVRVSAPKAVDDHVPVKIFALSPDGSTTIVCDDNRDPRHYIWNTRTFQYVSFTFPNGEDKLSSYGYGVAYASSGRFFAVANSVAHPDGIALRIWNTDTGALVTELSKLRGAIKCLAFSPNDRYIAFSYNGYISSGWDSTVVWIWDFRTAHSAPEPWKGHTQEIMTLAFSPNGERFASASEDGQIRFWSTVDLLGDSLASMGFMGVGTHLQDGWVVDSDGKLLFWVPTDNRGSLLWPRSTIIIGGSGVTTRLDLTSFRYGENWTECFGGD